jgi:hypothetical protein
MDELSPAQVEDLKSCLGTIPKNLYSIILELSFVIKVNHTPSHEPY